MNDIDIEDLMMEIFDEVEGTDFDEFTEIIELYNELGDIDSVATHIQDNLKVVKGAIKETKATIKAFEENRKGYLFSLYIYPFLSLKVLVL